MQMWRWYFEDRDSILKIFEVFLFTERSTFTEDIYYNYVKCFQERTIKLYLTLG